MIYYGLKKIWNNMKTIYISNHYRCAWILEQDENQVLKPIEFRAAPRKTSTRSIHMKRVVIDNFTKRVQNYFNDNPDKKIRQIQRIWYNSNSFDVISVFKSFGGSLTGVRIHLPRLWIVYVVFNNWRHFLKYFMQI